MSEKHMSLNDLEPTNQPERRRRDTRRAPVYESIQELEAAMPGSSKPIAPADNKPGEQLKKVDIYDVAPHRKVERAPTIEEHHLDLIDKAVSRTKKEVTELQNDLMEKIESDYNEAMNKEENSVSTPVNDYYDDDAEDDLSDLVDEDDYDEDIHRNKVSAKPEPEYIEEEPVVNNTYVAPEPPKVSEPKNVVKFHEEDVRHVESDLDEDIKKELGVDFLDDDDDEDEEDDSVDNSITPEEQVEMRQKSLKKLKEDLKTIVVPFKDKIDPTKFKIRKKPASIAAIMKDRAELKIADWGLFASGKSVTCSAVSALEIAKLDTSESTGSSRFTRMRTAFKVLYNSIVDENKPSFEDWLKSLIYSDADHIYFAIFKATFNGSCFFNHSCTNRKCNNTFIADAKFEDLVEYKDDEWKEKADRIVRSGNTNNGEYDSDFIQISENYCVTTRLPSAYNVIFETASLSDQFIEKYSDVIDIISFIEDIYYVDRESQQLIPVDTKPVKNDRIKTVSNRIRAYNAILNKLSSNEYSYLNGIISSKYNNIDGVSYKLPEVTCPKCGTVIESTPYTAEQLLFTRHRLGLFANT